MIDPTSTVACLVIAGAAALCDLVTRRIPNTLTLGGILLGVAIHGAAGSVESPAAALRAIGTSLLGAILCAILPGIGFWRGEMGGGDVKLFAAIGALIGPAVGFDAQALTFVIVLLVLWPWRLARAGVLRRMLRGLVRRDASERVDFAVAPVVLGPAICVGLLGAVARHGALP